MSRSRRSPTRPTRPRQVAAVQTRAAAMARATAGRARIFKDPRKQTAPARKAIEAGVQEYQAGGA